MGGITCEEKIIVVLFFYYVTERRQIWKLKALFSAELAPPAAVPCTSPITAEILSFDSNP